MPYQSSFTFIKKLNEALPKVLTKDCIKAWHCTGKLHKSIQFELWKLFHLCNMYIIILSSGFINTRYVKLLRPNSSPKSFINFALALQGMYHVQTIWIVERYCLVCINLKARKLSCSCLGSTLTAQTTPERIYNPITAMGFSAMFTFQLDDTKR